MKSEGNLTIEQHRIQNSKIKAKENKNKEKEEELIIKSETPILMYKVYNPLT